MPATVTQLSARSQTLIAVILIAMVVMAVSPFAEVVALRWPLRMGEPVWRYETFVMLLSNGPQLVILLGIIATIGALTGFREAVRGAAIGLALVVIAHILLVPLLGLDFLQVQRLVSQAKNSTFKMIALKTMAFGIVVAAVAAWAALRAWQASEKGGVSSRRAKGQGLVVGQDESPRTSA